VPNILGFLAGGAKYPRILVGGSSFPEGVLDFLGKIAWGWQISGGAKFPVTPETVIDVGIHCVYQSLKGKILVECPEQRYILHRSELVSYLAVLPHIVDVYQFLVSVSMYRV